MDKGTNKRNRKSSNQTKIEKQLATDFSIKNVVIVIITILLILVVFYFLTIVILNKKTNHVVNNASIQYTKILAGESFRQQEDEYLVFFYDMRSENSTNYADLVTKYREKKDHLPIYTVDLGEGFNKRYLSETRNEKAKKASELKIDGSTIIHFRKNKISEYITDSFSDYLEVE